mgnify:CR=1 FL=1
MDGITWNPGMFIKREIKKVLMGLDDEVFYLHDMLIGGKTKEIQRKYDWCSHTLTGIWACRRCKEIEFFLMKKKIEVIVKSKPPTK